MEGGGGDQELKHVCKVCKRNFPCGRSLGGHMRSHISMMNSSSEPDEKPPQPPPPPPPTNRSLRGLRENPKKNWRLSDIVGNASLKRGKLCRECGKSFPSWKSLFGHMRCHPDRSRTSFQPLDQEVEKEVEEEEKEECSWSGGSHKPDEEVTEVMVPRRKRRSRRTAAIASSSPSISEIERELEDVALVLMMLSRDVGFWGGINPPIITESSDKNSTVLEEEKGIDEEEEGEGGFFSDRLEKKGSEMGVNIRDGYLENGIKRVESDVSDDGFEILSRDDEFKMPKAYPSHPEFQQLRKKSSKKTRHSLSIGELGKRSRGDSEFHKYTWSKKGRFDAYESKLSRYDDQDTAYDAYGVDLGKNPDKKSRFQCSTCDKIFHSYQALGGHRASHKRIRGCSQGKIDGGGGENSTETEITDREIGVEVSLLSSSKKVKRHECPICFKVFPSGQALGGHKRSHMAVNSDNGGDSTCHQTMVVQQQRPDLLDLNLPAPAGEDSNNSDGNVGFKSWWVGSNYKREPLVGVVSN